MAHRRKSRRELPKPPLKGAVGLFLLALLAAFFTRGRRAPAVLREYMSLFGPAVLPPESYPDWIREELLPRNPWSRPGTEMEELTGIVVHYVGNPGTTAEQNRGYFAGLARSHETYASSHFLVGLEGEVLLCVPPGEVAYCSNSRNGDTLSIEVCHPDDTGRFTQAGYDSLVRLLDWLLDYYGLSPDTVIRHYDVTGKICPKYYVEHPEAWEGLLGELKEKSET